MGQEGRCPQGIRGEVGRVSTGHEGTVRGGHPRSVRESVGRAFTGREETVTGGRPWGIRDSEGGRPAAMRRQ